MGSLTIYTAQLSPRAILQQYRLPRSLSEAQEYLFRLQLCLRMLALYQHFFPQAYAHSTARALPLDHEAYSPREAEFIELVNERLFPIYNDFLLYAAAPDERSSVIPVCPLGRSAWEEDLADVPDIWRLAFFLLGEISAEDLTTYHAELTPPEDSPLRGAEWSRIDWEVFRQEWQVAALAHPPLAAVQLALEMAAHDTGNAFLDPTSEIPLENFYWNEEDVKLLVDHYMDANMIVEQVDGLLSWLREDPSHLGIVLEQMRACLHMRAPSPRASSVPGAARNLEDDLDEEEMYDDSNE